MCVESSRCTEVRRTGVGASGKVPYMKGMPKKESKTVLGKEARRKDTEALGLLSQSLILSHTGVSGATVGTELRVGQMGECGAGWQGLKTQGPTKTPSPVWVPGSEGWESESPWGRRARSGRSEICTVDSRKVSAVFGKDLVSEQFSIKGKERCALI